MNPKRIAALTALVLVVAMYIVTFVMALLATPETKNMFVASIAATVFIPIIAWIFIRLYALAHKDDDKNISLKEMRRINKRIRSGEDPEKIAEEIDRKYGNTEETKPIGKA